MAYKRNPMRSERIASLSKYIITESLSPAISSSNSMVRKKFR